jgi:cysteine desulfurase
MRLANNVNFSFEAVKGESILFKLDDAGVVVSRGSACASGFEEPSHILLALGLSKELALGAVRFSLGPDNTEDEIDYLLSILPGIVQELRATSPLA